MEQHNFKKGDKVRIVKNKTNALKHTYSIGEIVTVAEIDSDGELLCTSVRGLIQYVNPADVEPVEHKPEASPLPEIKDGYLLVVKTRGEIHNMTVVNDSDDELGCVTPNKHYWPVNCFGKNGAYVDSVIIAIYGRTLPAFLLDNSTDHRALLWEREESKKAEKMTVAEICKALGYEVEIVKDKA